MRRLLAMGALASALATSCTPVEPPPGVDSGPIDQCQTDLNFSAETADDLALATEVSGFLCPQRDDDFYRIQVPNDGTVMRVHLYMTTNITPIEPAYTILTGDGEPTGISASDPTPNDGPTDFEGAHRIDTAGTYLVVVADLEGFDANFDISNTYTLEVNLEPDPDANEPNERPDDATPITPGTPITGQIATTGDEDWYAVPVEQDAQILDVRASAVADNGMELVVEVIDPDAITLLDRVSVTENSEPDPNDAARVTERLRAAARGEASTVYYVKVTEADGRAELDPAVGAYTLNVTLVADPDPQEVGGGNDTAATATVLAPDTATNGVVATRADQDIFVLTPPGNSSPQNPGVLIVDVAFDATAEDFQPQIQILAHDPELADGELTACAAQEPACPDAENGNDAVRDPVDTICLPLGNTPSCGRPLLQRVLGDGETYTATAPVRRARPMYIQINELGDDNFQEGTGYTLTARFIDDPDPGEQGDDFLVPNLELATYDNVPVLERQLNRSRQRARDITVPQLPACAPPADLDAGPAPDAGPPANCQPVIAVPAPSGIQEGVFVECNGQDWTVNGTGALSYEGDRDYFQFEVPALGYWALDMTYSTSAASPVELATFIHYGGELNTSFVEATIDPLIGGAQICQYDTGSGCCDVLGCCAPTDQACLDSHVCIEGNCFVDSPSNAAVSNEIYPDAAQDECLFVHVNDDGRPVVIEITDNGINDFDTQMQYSFQVRVRCGCPDACNVVQNFGGEEVTACQGVGPPAP
jgi:hypothetical protein